MRQPLIEITPDQSVYEPATATCYVLITVTPAATDQPAQCLPRNLCLILDRSGSMHGSKIKAARDAACRVVDSLLPTDRLSVLASVRASVRAPASAGACGQHWSSANGQYRSLSAPPGLRCGGSALSAPHGVPAATQLPPLQRGPRATQTDCAVPQIASTLGSGEL